MSAVSTALEDAIERASASARRLEQAARHSLNSSSTEKRAQQRASANEAKQRVQALLDAHAAVAELVEADLEYDRARREWDSLRHDSEDFGDEQAKAIGARFEDAIARRVTALANMGPQS